MQCRRSFKRLIPYMYISLITLTLVWGCSSSSQPTDTSREVSNQDAVIVFAVSGWPDVSFTHKRHAEYWNNNCMECHMHTDVRDETLWECSECHSGNDAENLCTNDNYGHDCMFVQCVRCHRSLDTDPTPDCSDCHVLTENTGQFVDSAVTGLIYSTPALKGTTDSEGKFQYLTGETITFSIGDVIIGSGAARPVMTPVDLVPGARDETHQTVKNITRFLLSLDEDEDPSNGIIIPNDILNVIRNKAIDFSVSSAAFASNDDLQEILIALNKTLVEEDDAQAHLRATLLSYNNAPVASDVAVSGSLAVDYTVTGIYAYDDADGDEEGGSTYKWYFADDASGTNPTEIVGHTSQEITLLSADLGKFIIFEVTPGASSGIPQGTAVQSAAFGPIALYPTNSTPTATGCAVAGPLNTHFVLSGTYSYYDIDNDEESGSVYQWYRADDASGVNETAIPGADGLTYSPQSGDSGKYLIFKVTPAAATGNSPGSTCASAAAGPITTDTTLTVFASIDAAEEVDTYTIRLDTTTDASIDVESSELSHEGYYSGCNARGCISIPEDLGFPDGGPTNGPGNDRLTSNIFVFTSGGTVVDYRDGTEDCGCSSCHGYTDRSGYPGCDAPNAFSARNPLNPYVGMSGLAAGDYVVAIGAQYLTETDAWSGTNNNSNISGWADTSGGTFYNNYKITFTFN